MARAPVSLVAARGFVGAAGRAARAAHRRDAAFCMLRMRARIGSIFDVYQNAFELVKITRDFTSKLYFMASLPLSRPSKMDPAQD